MAVSFVGCATANTTTVSLPGGWAAGDIALVMAASGTIGSEASVPAGWTRLSGSALRTVFGYRTLVAGDTTIGTWTNALVVGVAIYTGVVAAEPFDFNPVYGYNAAWAGATTSATLSMAGYPGNNTGYTATTVRAVLGINETQNIHAMTGGVWTNRSSGVTGRFGVVDAIGNSPSSSTYTIPGGSSYWAVASVPLRAATAFPQVIDGDAPNGLVTTNSASWTGTYPTYCKSGDLLVCFLSRDGAGSGSSFPTNWVNIAFANSGANTLEIFVKKSDGTETGTFTMTINAGSEQGAWLIWRIAASTWDGTMTTGLGNQAASGAVCTTYTTGVSATPDPPSLDPFNWATESTLWLAACSVDTSRTFSGYPSTFGFTYNAVSGGAGGASLGLARLESAVSSLDPGTFAISASDDWGVATIAIRPYTAPANLVPSTQTVFV